MPNLAMDGVRRMPAAAARPVLTMPKKSRPLPPTRILAAGSVAFDGVRRPVTPLQVAETAIEPAPVAQATPAAPATWRPNRWLPAALGLTCIMLLGGFVGVRIKNQSQSAAASTSSAKAVAAPIQSAETSSQAQTPPVPDNAALQALLTKFAAGSPYGLYVKDLKTGEEAGVNPAQVFTSASIYKLYVAAGIYQRLDTGKLSLNSATSTGNNVANCLKLMITVSDNDCGRALGKILGWGAQDVNLRGAGFAGTSLADPQRTSAADTAKLLERLYRGTLLSPNSTDQFTALLKAQRVNNRLPVGLPTGTVIAHKTGDLDGYVHDVGIVYGPKTDYLVVALSGPWTTPANAAPYFSDLSQQLWTHFEQ